MTLSLTDESAGFQALADYCNWLASLPADRCAFRGHADASWQLIPSVARNDRRGIATNEHLLAWKELAGPVAGRAPASDVEWLVLAQHFTVPTPLLDWTTSPLAALYFACSELDDCWGHVYALPTKPFAKATLLEQIDPFATECQALMLLPAKAYNSRARAQHSVMTLHRPASTNAWGFSQDGGEHLGLRMKLYEIDPARKLPIRSSLSVLGFDQVTMMPDVQSAATQLRRNLGDRV